MCKHLRCVNILFTIIYISAIVKCLPLKQIYNSIDPLQQKVKWLNSKNHLSLNYYVLGLRMLETQLSGKALASPVWGPQFNTQYFIKKNTFIYPMLCKTELPSRTLLKENNIIFLLLFLDSPNNNNKMFVFFL